MASTQYITIDNDRWDSIAIKAYGDCTKTQIQLLQNANPYIPITMVFTYGIKIVVPILRDDADTSITNLLPPWKRTVTVPDVSQISATSSGSDMNSGFDSSFD